MNISNLSKEELLNKVIRDYPTISFFSAEHLANYIYEMDKYLNDGYPYSPDFECWEEYSDRDLMNAFGQHLSDYDLNHLNEEEQICKLIDIVQQERRVIWVMTPSGHIFYLIRNY